MTTNSDISYEKAKDLFIAIDGVLYKKVGSVDKSSGYLRTKAAGKSMLVHRLIFLLEHGYYPEIVDHIDGNKANNKIENLRAATKSQNCANAKLSKSNSSGVKNVNWQSQRKKWQVRLTVNNKIKCFGMYHDLELAELVAQEARDKYRGIFARHN